MDDLIKNLAERSNRKPGDFTDNTGFLVCGTCHARKQADVEFGDGLRRVPVACKCDKSEFDRQGMEKKRRDDLVRVEALRRDGLTDPACRNWTFESDDRARPDISDACRKYVDEWPLMRADNVGLLFYGNVGTGKSFLACCIANALIDKCIPVLVTSFPRILNEVQTAGRGDNRNDFYNRLQRYELVVIDDLGVERGTEYAIEQIYSAIDTRYRSGKPLVVTTNLTPAEIKNPANLGYARIYDRILQDGLQIKMTGTSRRSEMGARKRAKYLDFLGLKQ